MKFWHRKGYMLELTVSICNFIFVLTLSHAPGFQTVGGFCRHRARGGKWALLSVEVVEFVLGLLTGA